MKKITLALLALLIAVPLMAGDADEASLDLEGKVTTTFGVDLDEGSTGFQNSTTAKLEFHFNLPTTSLSSGSDSGPIYGEILLDEILLETVDSGDSSEVYWDVDVAVDYAKIMGAGWWISLMGPDNSMDFEDSIRDEHLGIATSYGGGFNSISHAQASSGGVEGAYTIDGVGTFGASLFSMTDWNDTSDDKNAYGATVEASISAVENLTLSVGAGMVFGQGDTTTLNDGTTAGAKVGYKLGLGGDLYLEPVIGFDLLIDEEETSYAIGNGVTLGIGGSSIANSDSTIHYRAGSPGDDTLTEVAFEDDTAAGIALIWDYYQAAGDVDAVLDLYAEAGITVIDPLQIAIGFGMDDALGADPSMGFGTYLGATFGSAYLDGGFVMFVDGLTVANAGVSITDIIPLVDLDVDWWSGDLSAAADNLGVVKFALSIAY